MGKRIVFMGAGAVGGYVGGHFARSGEDITLIDPWPEHIDYIKQNGIHLSGTQGDHLVRIKALHLHEVQSLSKEPVDIAFICTKSYDTEWATMMIKQYLMPDGFVVSLQNGINEERIVNIVGWGKVVGCIASTIGVDAIKAGHVLRTRPPGGSAYTVFRVGEVHGRITPRAQELAQMLIAIDSAKVTTNLWGERWSKLTQNSMVNGISACTGMNSKAMVAWETSRRVSIRLAGEAIRIGRALGYDYEAHDRRGAPLHRPRHAQGPSYGKRRHNMRVGSGNFVYEVIHDWGRLPAGWVFGSAPNGACDSHGRVYVFARGEHPVLVFDPDGNFLGSWGEDVFSRPHGILITPDDIAYCADDKDHTVRKCTLEGEVRMTLGMKDQPSDTGYDGKDWHTIARGGPPFNRPTNVALSPMGEMYVSDGYGNARVHKFTPDGELMFSWGEPGNGPGQFARIFLGHP